MQRNRAIVIICAIAAITTLEVVAILSHINGATLGIAVATIAALAGGITDRLITTRKK